MRFGLSDEQRLLHENVRRYLDAQAPLARVRRAADDGEAFAPELQRGLADLGVSGLLVPEAFGGVGLNLLDAVVVAEALGYAVAPAPFVATSVMAPLALLLAGSDAQQQAWLPRIAAGDAVIGVGLTEAVGSREGGGIDARDGTLTGRALFVLEAAAAPACIVVDRRGGLHLVEAGAPGMAAQPLQTIDRTRTATELTFAATPAAPLPNASPEVIARVLDAGRIALAADTLGAAQCMIDKAVAYAKEREQFGRAIASFQAVKHMCAEMTAQLEPCRSMVWYAGHAFDAIPDEARVLACHAKAHLAEVGRFVARTATEVHGGMGFTDLLGLHYWFKRIGFDRQILGGPERVREDAARAQGWVVPGAVKA